MDAEKQRQALKDLDDARECLNAVLARLDRAVLNRDWNLARAYRKELHNALVALDNVLASLTEIH
jgi:hypothetical protein